MEHFISGFRITVDKGSELKLSDKLKGHLLLLQADLASHERHIIISTASDSYNVQDVSAVLPTIFRNNPLASGATQRSQGGAPTDNAKCGDSGQHSSRRRNCPG